MYVVQLAAFVVSLNEPVAHGPQTRFVVVEPGMVIAEPAAHSAHATHAVVALASESHVPLAQATEGSRPPAQKFPAEQTEHTVSATAVPGVVTAEPSAHGVQLAQTVVVSAS